MSPSKIKNYAIILAAGVGSRFGGDLPKQFVKIAGKSVLEHTIEVFEKHKSIDEIFLVITPQYRALCENILLKNDYKKITKLLNGGQTRKESSSIAIQSIGDKEANLIIHDAARPFISDRIILDCINALKTFNAVDVAIPSADTIIQIKDNKIIAIPQRDNLRRGQTPQCFKLSLLKKAHKLAESDNNFTDDCGIVAKYNLCDIFVVNGEEKNIKITHKEDIFTADKLFQMHTSTLLQTPNLKTLKDKVLVCFGGNSGIGKAICELATQNGAKTFSFSRSNGVDIADFIAVGNALKKILSNHKKIDYVINSAGLLKMGKLHTRDFDDIKNELEINILGCVAVCKAVSQITPNTKILLFTSSSYTRGRALYSTYSASKAAVVNLTQALCDEGMQINVINPERTATPMRFNAFGKEPKDTLLSPQEVAKVSLEVLLSDINGQIIDVRKVNNADCIAIPPPHKHFTRILKHSINYTIYFNYLGGYNVA